MSKIFVYVSGPISKGDMFVNVRNAILAAERLRAAGLYPYVPHLSFSWHMLSPVDYEGWMDLDFAWIERCHTILRLPGESSGSDREVAHARALGLPAFTDIDNLLKWHTMSKGRPAGSGRQMHIGFTPCPDCEAFSGFFHRDGCPRE